MRLGGVRRGRATRREPAELALGGSCASLRVPELLAQLLRSAVGAVPTVSLARQLRLCPRQVLRKRVDLGREQGKLLCKVSLVHGPPPFYVHVDPPSAPANGDRRVRASCLLHSLGWRGRERIPQIGQHAATRRSALCAAIGAVGGVGAAALAVVPGGNGLIAFTATQNGNRDIAVLEPCGAVRTLIAGPAAELKPAWSPDGRELAFMSNRDGNFDIYVANGEGSGVRRLTDDLRNDFNPVWSPDGRTLAWNSDRSGDFGIYVMNANGGDVRRLTDAPGIDSVPSWSPRGERNAFRASRDGDPEIYVMNADGGDQH